MDKALTPHQKTVIKLAVWKWCEEHFPQMIEADFISICEVGSTVDFKSMLESLRIVKRSGEWLVPKSLIRQEAMRQFYTMAQWYKDAGQFGKRPSDIAIEKSVEESFRPFFDKNK